MQRNFADTEQIRNLLLELRQGDQEAASKLMALVYPSLRRLAGRFMREERRGHTLQATALVHEAYIRMAGTDQDWQDRAHFFAVAGGVMRRILADYARRRGASKRGGSRQRVELDELLLVAGEDLDMM